MAEKKPVFTKAQILGSERYANKKDIVGALLKDGGEYTTAAVDKLIAEYMKGGVK